MRRVDRHVLRRLVPRLASAALAVSWCESFCSTRQSGTCERRFAIVRRELARVHVHCARLERRSLRSLSLLRLFVRGAFHRFEHGNAIFGHGVVAFRAVVYHRLVAHTVYRCVRLGCRGHVRHIGLVRKRLFYQGDAVRHCLAPHRRESHRVQPHHCSLIGDMLPVGPVLEHELLRVDRAFFRLPGKGFIFPPFDEVLHTVLFLVVTV